MWGGQLLGGASIRVSFTWMADGKRANFAVFGVLGLATALLNTEQSFPSQSQVRSAD